MRNFKSKSPLELAHLEEETKAPADQLVTRDDTVQTIRTVYELTEAAKGVENSDRFLITVRRRDLPECWGIRLKDVKLPGYNIDLETVKSEITAKGFPQRAYFAQATGAKKQLRCMLIPKY